MAVYFEGTWGSVCDNEWDIIDADVACRQLGYLRAMEVVKASRFHHGEGIFWLDMVGCDGNEISLNQCRSNATGIHNCVYGQEAGVVCGNGMFFNLLVIQFICI